jgi:hypothetical protein
LVLLKGRRRIERQGTWSFKLGSSEAQEREKKRKDPGWWWGEKKR